MKELTLQEIQQGSLQVLLKIKKICEQENIKYWLAYGTLIGAVRHHGFIPWDDDIDIMMPRDDYERFVRYCIDHQNELDFYKLKEYRTCKEYIYGIGRFCDTRYKIDYTNAKDYGLGLFVDIYPMDGINPEDTEYLKKIKNLQRIISNAGFRNFVKSSNIVRTIMKYPFYLYCQRVNLINVLGELDKLSQKYTYNTSALVCNTCWAPKIMQDYYPKEYFDRIIFSDFEGYQLPIPEDYDKILSHYYGDYMKLPPESERIGHHYYTAYKK